jgi:hypothetical protein
MTDAERTAHIDLEKPTRRIAGVANCGAGILIVGSGDERVSFSRPSFLRRTFVVGVVAPLHGRGAGSDQRQLSP